MTMHGNISLAVDFAIGVGFTRIIVGKYVSAGPDLRNHGMTQFAQDVVFDQTVRHVFT